MSAQQLIIKGNSFPHFLYFILWNAPFQKIVGIKCPNQLHCITYNLSY